MMKLQNMIKNEQKPSSYLSSCKVSLLKQWHSNIKGKLGNFYTNFAMHQTQIPRTRNVPKIWRLLKVKEAISHNFLCH